MGCSEFPRQCAVACRLGELSQQPTWPQIMHIRRCTHESRVRRQSSQPFADGVIWRTSDRCSQGAFTTSSLPAIVCEPTVDRVTP
jgi:hypothetical protein